MTLSIEKFNSIIRKENLKLKEEAAIDFSNIIDTIPDNIIFDFCRKAFKADFHFDGGDEEPFSIKQYSGILHKDHSFLFGTGEIKYYTGLRIIQAEDLLITLVEKKQLEDALSNKTIASFNTSSI